MRVVLLGAPGAGKSTQARFICEKFGVPQLSTGDMLRAAMRERTPLGLKVEQDMKAGNLVSDAIAIELVRERLRSDDCSKGFLLDEFPRTLAQAEEMRATGMAIDYVLKLDVPDSEIVGRMEGRRVHPSSGRSYHIRFNPPRVENQDDVSGEPLVQREDDKAETVMRRLGIYHRESASLGGFYSRWAEAGGSAPEFRQIDGVGSVDAVRHAVFATLNKAA